MNYSLTDLFAQKSFEELTDSERALVLNEMTESEYRENRAVIQNSQLLLKQEMAELKPRSETKAIALQTLNKKKPIVIALFAHKVPTWMAVSACFLVFLLLQNFWNDEPINNPLTNVEQVDTIYSEKYNTQTTKNPVDTIIKVVYKTISDTEKVSVEKTYPPKEEKAFAYSDAMLNTELIDYSTFLSDLDEPKGKSVKEDTLTQWVNTTIY